MKTFYSPRCVDVIPVEVAVLFSMLVLVACSPTTTTVQLASPTDSRLTATSPQSAVTLPPATATMPSAGTTEPQTTNQSGSVEPTQASVPFPLSEPGPYFVSNRAYTLVDESRNGREIGLIIWYPALEQTDANGKVIQHEAAPDMSGAPYPLILTGPNSGGLLFKSHLASHGFVMATVRFPDLSYTDNWDFGVIDHPRDMIFTLNQIASDPPEGLEGVIDTDHVGVSGYSWDGFFSLALSGVRIDPEYYLSHCKQPPLIEPAYGAEWYLEYTCSLAEKWDEFATHVGDEITAGEDGLWQPVTDERIRAVMPMAADGAWLYGERGLAAADRPILMISPTEDEFTPYLIETKFIFEHLGSPQKSMISFIGKHHMMVEQVEPIAQLRHFVTAFLGYHLQEREDYAQYFSEDFVSQFDDLTWGIYEGK